MKIEIEIDIEAIVREEIRAYVKENIVIRDVSSGVKIGETIPTVLPGKPLVEETKTITHVAVGNSTEWEFGPKPGRRRSREEIALHELELKHNRLLTPEEKGEAKAAVEIEETAESRAKEDAINKDRIDKIAKEGMDAASKELADEETTTEEAVIPKTDNIPALNGMFT